MKRCEVWNPRGTHHHFDAVFDTLLGIRLESIASADARGPTDRKRGVLNPGVEHDDTSAIGQIEVSDGYA
jgi:hypothetical protein